MTRAAWGARRIRNELVRQGVSPVPAVSTVHAILRRHVLLTAVDDTGAARKCARA
ncbi:MULTISPECIES: hypothetical protein [unclassified Streptomyces]|uniref:hypothetical protein n=1 Tax=unclassified Streptomyces TaxID=2593676 RepID=UPI0036E883F0